MHVIHRNCQFEESYKTLYEQYVYQWNSYLVIELSGQAVADGSDGTVDLSESCVHKHMAGWMPSHQTTMYLVPEM